MAPELLVLADDLTGAADTAAQFSKQGVRAAVSLSPRFDPQRFDQGVSVLAIDTESRHCEPADAFGRVVSLVKQAGAGGIRRFYKKIDSTLRGNVGAELEALMLGCRTPRLPLVPAYPKGGRTTAGGRQYVQGTPLDETSFARDPRERATTSDITAILRRQTALPVHVIESGPRRERRLWTEREGGIFIFDAQTDEDLSAIGALLDAEQALDVVAGAAGFAELLPGLLGLPASRPYMPLPDFGPLLVINGSLQEVSLEQVAAARNMGIPCVAVAPETAGPAHGAQESAKAIASDLARTGCVIVTTAFSADGPPREPPGEEYLTAAAAVTAAVAALVPGLSVAVFGGDTAFSVCRALECETLFPVDEVSPGITVSAVRNTAAAAPAVGAIVLKSGGFGPRDAVGRIREYIGEKTKGAAAGRSAAMMKPSAP